MTHHTIQPGQIYETCDPLDERRQIRVIAIRGGRVKVETVTGPARQRWMWPNALHATAVTASGQPRRTGYALVDEAR